MTAADHTPSGPSITDHETGEPIDAGCAAHSGHWLARAVRQNRRNLGYPPQECQHRPSCPVESTTAEGDRA